MHQSKETSYRMSQIHSKETTLEIKVRKYLFEYGYRYRKNVKSLPGTPDIVLAKYKTAIFINGCFWHHHKECKLAYMPKTNVDFWTNKFDKNIKNDKKHSRKLRTMGYHVITVWECRLKKDFNKEMRRVINLLNSYLSNS